MTQPPEESAEQAVTATTDSYGGPVSDKQLAAVYLPQGQDEVHERGADDDATAQDDPTAQKEEATPDSEAEPSD